MVSSQNYECEEPRVRAVVSARTRLETSVSGSAVPKVAAASQA